MPSHPNSRAALWLTSSACAIALFGCEIQTKPLDPSRASVNGSTLVPGSGSEPTTAALRLTPGTGAVGIGKKLDFSASGGIPPYIFSASGGGSVSSLGSFSAPYVPGTVTVTVQDSRGVTTSASVSVTVGTSVTPNDPSFANMPALHQTSNVDINGPEAWSIHNDCRSVVVGVLDTGIDHTHPDLAANIRTNPNETAGNNTDDDGNGFVDDIRGWNFINNTSNAADDQLHGTHVAGTIGAVGNNSLGVTGVCWRASIVPLKFLDNQGSGALSDAIEGIDYSIASGIKVINASFGGGGFSQNFKDALDRANTAGILFVAAAGNETNDNDANPAYPASYSSANVISVAAVSSTDAIASFSNFGATSVHIAAPGVNILSTFPTSVTASMTQLGKTTSYEQISGTSMATPHVVGVAALAWSFEPSLTVAGLRSRILDRTDTVAGLNGKVVGSRRLNARKVLYAP